MCNRSGLDVGKSHLPQAEVRGKDVLEAGARDVNGSLRSVVQPMLPARYLGVDIIPSPRLAPRYEIPDMSLMELPQVHASPGQESLSG